MGGNEKRAGKLQHISEAIRERNITLSTTDPVARGGFTQVPNFILNDPNMSLGAKVIPALSEGDSGGLPKAAGL